MKEVYLAYFDLLGFKEFINNNEDKELMRRMGHVFRDIEMSLGQDKYQEPHNGIVLADISKSKLNCLNISDTIIVWTSDCELDSLKELLNVAYDFNWRMNGYNFPLRGAIIRGKVNEVTRKQINPGGGSYSVQCVFGKGYVEAHEKAESQNWAGTVIDRSIINDLEGYNELKYIDEMAMKFNVPYKNGEVEEHVFKLKKGPLNAIALENVLKDIDRVFASDNKSVEHEGVRLKIENTKRFVISDKE
jgi:hypothetical protein